MNEFLSLSGERRRLVFEQSAVRLNLPEIAVEKDFWVCMTLRTLFQLPGWGPGFTFKGGTSLSKGWKLIERFSEDVDIVIDRAALGYADAYSLDEGAGSSRRKRILAGIKAACREAVQGRIAALLRTHLAASIAGGVEWDIVSDEGDPDGQTLLFVYPSLFAPSDRYVQQIVRIEMGARSDTEPTETVLIVPYIAEAFPDLIENPETPVRAVSPLRTFWEKALLLHEEWHRPEGSRPRGAYMARHYYDLFRLIEAGVATRAAADLDLFERIVRHRSVFFRYGWIDYATLKRGSLRLVPDPAHMSGWESDYDRMRPEMFFGDVPTFARIMNTVQVFQDQFNGGK